MPTLSTGNRLRCPLEGCEATERVEELETSLLILVSYKYELFFGWKTRHSQQQCLRI